MMQAVEPLLLRSETDIPWVPANPGSSIRVPHYDIDADMFVLHSRLDPGYRSGRHRHSGDVFVITLQGAWKYEEHDEVIRPGNYLFEPAGSLHTLHVLDDNPGVTEFWAIVHGALEYVGPDGTIVSRLDAAAARELYENGRLSASAGGAQDRSLP